MNNKETLQQHNTRLSENNVDIKDILNTVNSLPTIDEVVSLQDKTVEPSKETQVITADGEYTGLGTVTVNAIQTDSLEVQPSIEEKNYKGLYSDVKVNAVTSEVDSNIVAENIKKDVEILGVKGTLTGGKYKPRYMYQPILFKEYTGTELDHEVSMLDTIHFTDMSNMFNHCNKLTSLDLSNWNTSNVTNMSSMFYSMKNLQHLDVSNFDTSNVTNMSTMFYLCQQLTSLDLSNWNTSNVTNMSLMFYSMRNLQHLDIRNFTFDSVTSYSSMFSSVPKDCLIIVKGETEKGFVLTARSDLTNVKTVAELGE